MNHNWKPFFCWYCCVILLCSSERSRLLQCIWQNGSNQKACHTHLRIIRWNTDDETNLDCRILDVYPSSLLSQIVFWNNVNRKCKTNFPKSDKNHYSDPLKDWKFRHPYEMINCRGGKNRALRWRLRFWHTHGSR